jgi:SpoVK/Ycf46/Vps4 family AAA+-type ATPase
MMRTIEAPEMTTVELSGDSHQETNLDIIICRLKTIGEAIANSNQRTAKAQQELKQADLMKANIRQNKTPLSDFTEDLSALQESFSLGNCAFLASLNLHELKYLADAYYRFDLDCKTTSIIETVRRVDCGLDALNDGIYAIKHLHELQLLHASNDLQEPDLTDEKVYATLTRLSKRALNAIHKSDNNQYGFKAVRISNHKELLEEVLIVGDFLEKLSVTPDQLPNRPGTPEHGFRYDRLQAAMRQIEAIDNAYRRVNIPVPFYESINEAALDTTERAILMSMITSHIRGCPDPTPEAPLTRLCSEILETLEVSEYFSAQRPLRLGSFIMNKTLHGIFNTSSETVTLTPTFLLKVMPSSSVHPSLSKPTLDSLLEDQTKLSVVNTSGVAWEDVVLSADLRKQVNQISETFDPDYCECLERWGVASTVTRSDEHKGKTVLLSGPSGTGKTFIARALASKFDCGLITTDASHIMGSYVGESQSSLTKIIETYRKITESIPNPPILLLNECDQFFANRGDFQRGSISPSVDLMHRQLQNLFLEFLERPCGIIVATTNLVDALDAAYSRRFDHKLTISLPDSKERQAIWEGHLPRKVPVSTDVNMTQIARQYEFSGGQIALTMKNALTEAARTGRLSMKHLVDACEYELCGAFGSESTKHSQSPIGFKSRRLACQDSTVRIRHKSI